MFSGGLDSRLAVKIMQEQGFEVVPVFFRLPFGCGCCNEMGCSFNFSQVQGIKLEVFDCNKGDLFKDYMKILKKGSHGRGAGVNPCRDCKIFMFERVKKFADKKKINLIVTGDVLGERPMSQMKSSLMLIEERSGLKGRILRPLSAKLLPETEAEKKGLVDREKLYDIQGRRREKQIALAKKFKIKYPHPAGGCLLCERLLIKRFEFLFKRGLKEKEIPLVNIGRHFKIPENQRFSVSKTSERAYARKSKQEVSDNDCWVVLGRNEKENEIIETVGKNTGELIIPDFIGPSALIIDKYDNKLKEKVNDLIKTYSKKGSIKERKRFEKYKL